MVSRTNQANLGSTSLSVWTSLDIPLHHNRHYLRIRPLSLLKKTDQIYCCASIFTEPRFQLCFQPDSIRIKKQLPRPNRYSACLNNPNLEPSCHLPKIQVDHLCKHSILTLGFFCHSAPSHNHLFELVDIVNVA